MSATRTVRPSVHRGQRIAACLLSVGALVVLAGCGAGESAEARGLVTVTASPSARPSPTPNVAPSPSPAASTDPATDTTTEPIPDPAAEPEAAAPGPVAEAPSPSATAPTPAPVPAPMPAPAPAVVAPPAPAPAVPASGSPSTAGAQALLASANSARSAAGLPPLAYSSALESVASGWTSSMAGSGTLGHNPNYASQIPVGATSFGENVGYAGGFADNAATIHAGWMDSPGHRENILRTSFTQVGIGYVVDANGTAWATQVFAGY